MAYSIGGIPVILNTREIEAVSIKLGTGETVSNIINSGIDTSAGTGALITDSAFNEIINPIIANVADAINPTDADFSTTDLVVKNLTADAATGVITAFQFDGDGSRLTSLDAAAVTGTLADANVASTNVTQHEGLLAIDGSQLTGVATDAFIPSTAVTQHQGDLAIDASTQLSGTVQDSQFPAILPAVSGQNLTNVEGTLIPGSNVQAGVLTATEFNGNATGIATNLLSVSATNYYGSGEFLTDISAENANTVTLAEEAAASGNYPLTFAAAGTGQQALLTNTAATIDPSTGQVTFTQQVQANNGVNETSDARLKENVQEIEGGLEKVKSLRGVTFDWKESSGIEGGSVGVIAQELLAVLPEAVNTNNEEKYTVNYNGAIALLISAVKELSAEVEALKAAK